MTRVPFAVAIADDKLLGIPWKRLSLPQQVALKSFYGLPLDPVEQRIWSAQQGPDWAVNDGVYDELGYLTGNPTVIPYTAQEHDIFTGVIGRRAGKSTEITGFIGAYEISLGGHGQYANGAEMKFLYVAQEMSLAQTNMQGIVRTMRLSPLLSELLPALVGIEQVKFKNGITLEAMSNTIKSARGYAVCGVVMDELGFWYKDAKSANPDTEVEIAISYAMQQFEHAKQIRITTPWTKEGLAYEARIAGTEGRRLPKDADQDDREKMEGHLVVYAPTAAMGVPVPLVTRKKLARKKKRDPIAFARESLALFIDAQAGFLSHAKVNEAVERGKAYTVVYNPDASYVAVMDPAFRGDDYSMTVGHKDAKLGIVQDHIQVWTPEPGARLSPGIVLDEIKAVLDKFGLGVIYSDQVQLESLQELALDRDFTVFGFDLTKSSKPKVMQALNLKLNADHLVLLNYQKQTNQLKDLQRTVNVSGYTAIAAPPGKMDDCATVLALMVHLADMLPAVEDAKSATAIRNSKQTSANLAVEATRIYEAALRSGDPLMRDAIARSDYLRALMEEDTGNPDSAD